MTCLVIAFALAGCVTRGTHQQVVSERDGLQAERSELKSRVRLLEASNESLSGERVKLIDQIEDLRGTQTTLETNVRKLERRRAELSETLSAHKTALSQREDELRRLKGTYQGLVQDLEAEVREGLIQIEHLRDGLRLNLSEGILFDSGSAGLNPRGRDVLSRVAKRLRELPDRVEVRGHTDNIPITRSYPSNWELAATRATGVVRWLESQGVDPRRLRGVSFGEHHPVAPNDTPEGRAANRRIELLLLPAMPGADPPEAAAASGE